MSGTVCLLVPLLLGVAAVSTAAEIEKEKPVCNARMRGKLWPEKTSKGSDIPVEICAPKGWHYHWQQLTVDVSQLKTAVKRKQVIAALPAAAAPSNAR